MRVEARAKTTRKQASKQATKTDKQGSGATQNKDKNYDPFIPFCCSSSSESDGKGQAPGGHAAR
eukprot:5714809-Pleurochrysis_carterae.AAC.1